MKPQFAAALTRHIDSRRTAEVRRWFVVADRFAVAVAACAVGAWRK